MQAEVLSNVTLTLLQGFMLKAGWKLVPLMWSAQRLVALLALTELSPSRAYVAGTLWPETTDARANANLRSSLWRVQRACGRLVVASSQQLCLAPSVAVDLQGAVAVAYRMLDSSDGCEDVLNVKTLSVLSADLLPDWYEDDWVVVHRERYHHLRLHALEAMCERLTSMRRYGEAVEAGLAAVRAEPLRESAHQTLIKVHLAEGNRVEANRQYKSCRCLLRNELGLEPSPGLKSLLTSEIPNWHDDDSRIRKSLEFLPSVGPVRSPAPASVPVK
jgi:DNA-binding SARP family transcriptional activator